MTANDTRDTQRAGVRKLEVVTVYRDRRDLGVEEAATRLDEESAVYRLYSVVAEVRDFSDGGIGIRFIGQQLRARNMLRSGERYLIKLALPPGETAPEKLMHTHRSQGYLLFKGYCRWHRPGRDRSSAGFELDPYSERDLVAFLRQRLGTGNGDMRMREPFDDAPQVGFTG